MTPTRLLRDALARLRTLLDVAEQQTEPDLRAFHAVRLSAMVTAAWDDYLELLDAKHSHESGREALGEELVTLSVRVSRIVADVDLANPGALGKTPRA